MKFFYYLGVYVFCTSIHETFKSTPEILKITKHIAQDIRDIKDIYNGRMKMPRKVKEIKEETGFRPKKVVNKIGF